MKTIVLSLIVSVALLACHKTETPKPTPTHPVAITPATGMVGNWQYSFDACKKLSITADSIKTSSCTVSVTHSYTALGGDTVLTNGQKVIIRVVGDTMTYVPAPYTVWDSKYYRH